MNQKKNVQLLSAGVLIFCILISLSGCTTNQIAKQNTNGNENTLLGTWVGTLQMQMFGGGSNVSVTQITFTNNAAELTLGSAQGSFIMNYSYSVNGNTLVLQPTFNNRGGFPGGQSFNGTMPPNGTRPPGNGTWPQNGTMPKNGTWPANGTRPPGNETWPQNGTQPPGNQQPPASISFTYRFNDDDTMLYLNETQFTRIS
jgi:hypothetical protein